MPAFARTIGIDYSGAETPTASLKGLRVYLAEADAPPVEVLPPPSLKKYWTRRGIAEWLVAILSEDVPTLVGIDHGFSFPLPYFEVHGLEHDWATFLDDFQRHWPTDEDHTYVDFVRDGAAGNGAARMGNTHWRRLTEERAGSAKSVFHFDVQGSVAKSTHAGILWLRFIRQRLGSRVHFWPFDGWEIPPGRSAVAEVYPALWSRSFAKDGRTGDQHDAYCIAAWLSRADRNGSLAAFLKPELTPPERTVAQVEGWILGVPGLIRSDLDRKGHCSSGVRFCSTSVTSPRCRRGKSSGSSMPSCPILISITSTGSIACYGCWSGARRRSASTDRKVSRKTFITNFTPIVGISSTGSVLGLIVRPLSPETSDDDGDAWIDGPRAGRWRRRRGLLLRQERGRSGAASPAGRQDGSSPLTSIKTARRHSGAGCGGGAGAGGARSAGGTGAETSGGSPPRHRARGPSFEPGFAYTAEKMNQAQRQHAQEKLAASGKRVAPTGTSREPQSGGQSEAIKRTADKYIPDPSDKK